MKILNEFNFDSRPSRSRYAPVVDALVKDGKHAVEIKRGEDFPANLKLDTVQSAITTQIRKHGKRARTYRVDDDTLVVGLRSGDAPARRPRRTREAVPA